MWMWWWEQEAAMIPSSSLGQGKVGEVLDPAPAKIFPTLGGSWKWQTTNALRFQPSGGLPVASEYKVELDPAKIVKEGQVFTGETELTVRTDKFLVEEVTVLEEPALEGKAKVVYRGEIRFNYPVNPETLAPLVKIEDPEAAKPIEVKLETDYQNQVIGYRTEPVQKKRDERKIRLIIPGALTPANGNAPLGEEYVKEIEVGSSTKLSVRNVEAMPGPRESTIKVTFSSPISAAVAEKYVKIDPAVRVRFAAERNELSITGEMEPGATYTLAIGKGMPATDEAVLQEDFQQDVELPDLEPTVGFQSQGMFLWTQGQHAVALEAVNVPKVRMTIDRVYLNNLFFLFQYGGFFEERDGLFRRAQPRPGRPAEGDDARRRRPQEQAAGLSARPRQVRRHQGARASTASRWASRTTTRRPSAGCCSPTSARSPSGARGSSWSGCRRSRTSRPSADAKVTLISDQNQTAGLGADGRLRDLAGSDAKALAKGTPYMVTIEKGDDFTFLLLDQMTVDTDRPGRRRRRGRRARGTRPSSTASATSTGRARRSRGWRSCATARSSIPPSMPALLRHRDPQGRELETAAADDGRQRARAVRARSAGLLADRPAHAGAGGGREGHRPVPLPGRGVRAGPDLGRDRAAEGEGRAGAEARLPGAVELPVRRAGRGAAGRDPGAAGGLDVLAQGLRGVQLPQRRPQAGGQARCSPTDGQARRRGAQRASRSRCRPARRCRRRWRR